MNKKHPLRQANHRCLTPACFFPFLSFPLRLVPQLVIMTEHLYTPSGMVGGGSSGTRRGGGSSKYKGKDAAVVELLEFAVEKGVDIDWDHGTVSFSESGYGEGGHYGYRYGYGGGGGYSWGETNDSTLELSLSSWGKVGMSVDEMVPEDFYEDKDCETTYEPTGNEGVTAERQYEDEDAIVVWPRSQRWTVVTNNELSKMLAYLQKACTPGTLDSEPKAHCIAKAQTVIPKLIQECSPSSSCGYNSSSLQANVSSLLNSLLLIGDQQLALEHFLGPYIAATPNSTPDLIVSELLAMATRFGPDTIRPHLLPAVNQTRFLANPSKTSHFVLKVWDALKPAHASLAADIVTGFVDAMAPDVSSRRPPSRTLESFPLSDILGIFRSENAPSGACSLVRRVVDAVVWISCQPMPKMQERYSYSTARTVPPKGSNVLLNAGLAQTLERFGWKAFEPTLVGAVETLCAHGSTASAVGLVEELAPPPSHDTASSERSQVCERLATLACKHMLSTQQQSPSASAVVPPPATLLDTYKKLFKMIMQYCPSQADVFVTAAEKLSVDEILVPFVTDGPLRASARDEVERPLAALTKFCIDTIEQRLSVPLGTCNIWTIPGDHCARNSNYSGFLSSPCRRVCDWQVRKSDHREFEHDLSSLIRMGEVHTESYQPSGRGLYHFKITKKISRTVSVANMAAISCGCSSNNSAYSSYRYASHQYSSSSVSNDKCLIKQHQERIAKRRKDEKTLADLIQLLPSKLRTQQTLARKRPAEEPAAVAACAALPHVPGQAGGGTGLGHAAKKKKYTPPSECIDLT
jgi:hypothetical protein